MNKNLTVVEVADTLGVNRYTVYDWIADGKIKAEKFGTSYMVLSENFLAYIHEVIAEKKAEIAELEQVAATLL